MSRPSRHLTYMRMALLFARRSTCDRRAVGCILTDEAGTVLGMGYNGPPAGESHCLDEPCASRWAKSGAELEGCRAVHAEQNALIRCKDWSQIHTAYCTTFPCLHCQKMLLNTPCELIVYNRSYGETDEYWDRRTFVVLEA